MELRVWYITNDEKEYDRVIADSFEEADKILFLGICNGEYPENAILIEEIIEEDYFDEEIIDVDEIILIEALVDEQPVNF